MMMHDILVNFYVYITSILRTHCIVADHVPLHGERVVLLGHVHQHAVRDQWDVRPHHVQGQVVGHPHRVVTPGLAADVVYCGIIYLVDEVTRRFVIMEKAPIY